MPNIFKKLINDRRLIRKIQCDSKKKKETIENCLINLPKFIGILDDAVADLDA